MMDFDYFSVYGPSSVDYLENLKWSYGSCQFLYGGSYLFDEGFSLPAPVVTDPIVFLGMGPQLEKTNEGLKIYQLVAAWQKKTKRKLFVRLHHRSERNFWNELNQEGVTVLDKEEFHKSMERSSLVLASYTNAVIDACLLNRPCQLIASKKQRDKLKVESFFGHRVFSVESLETAVVRHFNDYDNSVLKCKELIDYHLLRGSDSVNYLTKIVQKLVSGDDLKSDVVRRIG